MKRYVNYYVELQPNGNTETRVKQYQAASPGNAFLKAHREFRDAKLIRAWRQSENPKEPARIIYEAPSVAKVSANGLVEKLEQPAFAFMASVPFQRAPIRTPASWSGITSSPPNQKEN
jgi:hypothetical protein